MVLERVSADDRLILWPDVVWPKDVGALAILDAGNLLRADGSFRIEAARDAVEARLHLLPRFRQVLYEPGRGLGGPLWVDCRAFDIRDHVNAVAVGAPGDEAQLLATVKRCARRRLDRSRPLWEMWFLQGVADRRVVCSSGCTTSSPTASPAWPRSPRCWMSCPTPSPRSPTPGRRRRDRRGAGCSSTTCAYGSAAWRGRSPRSPILSSGPAVSRRRGLVNLLGTVSLGVAALSYAATFHIMVVTDADAYPDLEVFATGVRDDLGALAATARSAIGA